jgi:hypothetical protein
MTANLDLVIALTPPPADAPPETPARFELHCPTFGRRRAEGLLTELTELTYY